MTLTGQYAERAKGSYKTMEGRTLLSAVRQALALLDEQMKKPASYERGAKIASILSALELATDQYDLFGEKDRRRKKNQKSVRIIMDGGLIQEVRNIPQGIEIEVFDYDCSAQGDDHPNMTKDEQGKPVFVNYWPDHGKRPPK